MTAAETANFHRAATRLRVSQPTLTSQVATLERALGLSLFERSRSGSSLTPAGRELLPTARRVLEEQRELLQRAQSIASGPVGTYRLGVTPTLGPYLLPHVLPRIHRRFEELKFYVREGAPRLLEQDLRRGDHDLVLTALPIEAGDLTVFPLFREPLRLVLSAEHRLADKPVLRPADLRDEPVLTLEEHHLFHRQTDRLCQRLGARLLRDYEGTSLDTLRQMVVLGMGIAFLPSLYVRSEIHAPESLRVATVEGESMERMHALVWRPTSPTKALFETIATALKDVVASELAQDAELEML